MYLSIGYWRKLLQYYLLILGTGVLMYGLMVQLAWSNVTPAFLPQVREAIVIPVERGEEISGAVNLAKALQKQEERVVLVSNLAELDKAENIVSNGQIEIIKPWQWAWLQTYPREKVSKAMLESKSPQTEIVSTRFGDSVVVVKDLQIDSQDLVDIVDGQL